MNTFCRSLLITACLVLVCVLPVQAATQDATVAFPAPTVNPSSVTGYKIERCQGAGCTAFVQIGTTSATILTYLDVNLPQGTVFCYREIATSAMGDSSPSPAGCSSTAGTPGAPGQPTITITIKP